MSRLSQVMSVSFAVANEMILAVDPNCDKVVRLAEKYGMTEKESAKSKAANSGLLHAAPKEGLVPGTRIWAVCAAKFDEHRIVTNMTTFVMYGDFGCKMRPEFTDTQVAGKVMFMGILTEAYHHSNPYIHVNLCPTPYDEPYKSEGAEEATETDEY